MMIYLSANAPCLFWRELHEGKKVCCCWCFIVSLALSPACSRLLPWLLALLSLHGLLNDPFIAGIYNSDAWQLSYEAFLCRCRAATDAAWQQFREQWTQLHPLNRGRRFEALASLQPLAELEVPTSSSSLLFCC